MLRPLTAITLLFALFQGTDPSRARADDFYQSGYNPNSASTPRIENSLQKPEVYRGPQVQDPVSCKVDFARLEKFAKIAAKSARYTPEPLDATGRGFLRRTRDRITEALAFRHQHHFSAIHAKDTSPLDSWQLAQDSFGRFDSLPEEQRALFPNKVEDIKARLLTDAKIPGQSPPIGLIEYVETYPKRLAAFTDEIHTAGAQILALRKAIKQINRNKRSENFSIELPYLHVNADGSYLSTMKQRYFPTRNSVKAELKRLEGLTTKNSFSTDQLQALEVLERFMQQIRAQVSREANLEEGLRAEMKPEVKEIFERILRLYKNSDGINLKPEYRVNGVTWEKMRQAQFWSEIRAVRERDVPRIGDRMANDKLLIALRSLPQSVVRDVGLGNLARSTTFLGRSKPAALAVYGVSTLTGVGATGLGVSGVSVSEAIPAILEKAGNMFREEEAEREGCIATEDNAEFVTCVRNYIKKKFSAEAEEELDFNDFFKTEGDITTGTPEAELQAIAIARVDHLKGLALAKEFNTKIEAEIEKIVSENDPGSEDYRKKVLETEDSSVFTHSIFGEEPILKSMLGRLFPDAFKRNKEAIRKLLFDQALGSPEQEASLKALEKEKVDKEIAAWLRAIINERVNGPDGTDGSLHEQQQESNPENLAPKL